MYCIVSKSVESKNFYNIEICTTGSQSKPNEFSF